MGFGVIETGINLFLVLWLLIPVGDGDPIAAVQYLVTRYSLTVTEKG